MIRTLAITLALSTSFVALSAMDAAAQTTEQTDKSEEDWRKSQKKRDTSDIFEDILNRRNTGQGSNQYPQNPIDSLPEESRRHLMKERAKVIAESDPNTTPDAPYTPSEAAKTDPELAEQEKEAWTVIMTDMKGGASQGQGQGGSGPNKIAVAGQGGGQSGGQSGGQGNDSSRSPSVMRGGSSQSVAEIMAQIKGMKSGRSGGTGTVPAQGPMGGGHMPQGQGSSGQSPLGQGTQGQSQTDTQTKAAAAAQQAAEAQAQADAAAKAASEAAAKAQSDAGAQAEAEAAAKAASDAQAQAEAAAEAASQAEAEARAETIAKAEAATHAPEPIGPLERIKRERETNTSGTQTSASDFLKKREEQP